MRDRAGKKDDRQSVRGQSGILTAEVWRKEQGFVLAATLLLLIVTVFLGSSMLEVARSTAADEAGSYKYYTSIEIMSGDTLWTIADRYMSLEYTDPRDYIEEVMELNGLADDKIHAGQYIMIPYYSTEFKQ